MAPEVEEVGRGKGAVVHVVVGGIVEGKGEVAQVGGGP